MRTCAAVARIDGRIGLQIILVGSGVEDAAPVLGADDSLGDGLVEPAGMTDGHHPVADFHLVRVAKGHRRQLLIGCYSDYRQIGFRVGANQLAWIGGAVGQQHIDLGRSGDHVVVGQDIAFIIDQHAGSQTSQRLLELLRCLRAVEKEMEKRIVAKRHHGVRNFPPLDDVDVDHGW